MQLQCLLLMCVWAPMCVSCCVTFSVCLLSHFHLALCATLQHGAKSCCYCCHCVEAVCICSCCSQLLLSKEQVSVDWKPKLIKTVVLLSGGVLKLLFNSWFITDMQYLPNAWCQLISDVVGSRCSQQLLFLLSWNVLLKYFCYLMRFHPLVLFYFFIYWKEKG